jgi:cysteine desulfurase/selenocysteine lyase
MLNPYEIRKDFPILRRRIGGNQLIYFDNAASSQKPIQVLEAVKNFYETSYANVHRGVHTLSQEASELYEEAHREVAKFINAEDMEEIVFVRGTTEAVNLVAYTLGLNELTSRDEVVVTLMDHHSNIVPWEILSKIKGFRLRYVGLTKEGLLNYQALSETLTPKTRLVCIPHVSNVTGIINDVRKIARMAHEHEALIFVDGAQSVPHMPVDVKALDVDFLAFSGHKMLAPTGIGVLYCKRRLLEGMAPFHGGGSMIKQVTYDNESERCVIEWSDLPWKFEAGTPNIGGGIGLMKAVEYLQKIGMENVERHEKELTRYALERLGELEKVQVIGSQDISIKSGIIPFLVEKFDSHDIALFLDNFGIMVRSGFHCAQPLHQQLGIRHTVRASFYIYNTQEEIDKFVQTLGQL